MMLKFMSKDLPAIELEWEMSGHRDKQSRKRRVQPVPIWQQPPAQEEAGHKRGRAAWPTLVSIGQPSESQQDQDEVGKVEMETLHQPYAPAHLLAAYLQKFKAWLTSSVIGVCFVVKVVKSR